VSSQSVKTTKQFVKTTNVYSPAFRRNDSKEQGALEVLLQCGNFAYMNPFTDGLRLPSEDEAIETYQET